MSFSTSAAGSIRVEIQDAGARPIPGYSLSESHETFGDDSDRIVARTGGPEVSRLAAQRVRLRFALKDADLFAVQFRDAEPRQAEVAANRRPGMWSTKSHGPEQ